MFEHYEQIYNLLQPDLNGDFFIELNELKDEILKETGEIYGYWKSKSDKIKAARPGSEAKRKKAENRINQVKKGVEEIGTITDEGIKISSSQYDDIVRKALGYKETSIKYDRTSRTYKNKIEMMLSEEKGRDIKIILI